ncbi:MAG TPA: hypothetical protein VF669_06705 [Tepidisphaeraceae bacterium]|jgi:hypothetical protein
MKWIGFAVVVCCLAVSVAGAAEATTKPAEGKLKVGVLVSQYTATGPNLGGRPYGYDHAKVTEELKDDSVQMIPIIEPGSEEDADLAGVIKERFPDADNQVFLASDENSMKSLDAIVLARVPNMNEDVLDGVGKAVQSGVSLLVLGRVGNVNPGYKDNRVSDLVGMTEAEYAWSQQPQPMEIVAADDPLLKDVPSEGLVAMPAGVLGKLKEGSKPLIKLSSKDALKFPKNEEHEDRELDYYTLYLTSFGKGQICVCNWTALPRAIRGASEQNFYIRVLHRLAEMRKK